jgi:hypothetical protein
MMHNQNCQIPCLQEIAEGRAAMPRQPLVNRVKRVLAKPWNYHVKKWLKRGHHYYDRLKGQDPRALTVAAGDAAIPLKVGDRVRVRSREEIQATLNPWNELRGCAFLDEMWQYCGTTQRVLQSMERFLDERDYKVKKTRGVILLENVICRGTPVFGRCDRCCFLFWREEWLEKIGSG